MKNKVIGFFKSYRTIITRVLFTFLFVIIFQTGTYITVPGVEPIIDSTNHPDEFISFLSMMGGGVINKLSIFAIGISPFITASIIVQLLSSGLIPKLTEWSKQGKKGQIKINYLTKTIMVPIGYAQALGILSSLSINGIIKVGWNEESGFLHTTLFYYFLIPLTLIAGTMIVMFIADLITNKGIGSGTSFIIFSGILITTANQIWSGKKAFTTTFSDSIIFIIYLILFLILFISIIFLNNSQRKIPIQQSGSGLRLENQQKSYLPIKLNPSGIIPVIFAQTLISFLGSISKIVQVKMKGEASAENFSYFVDNYLSFSTWWGIFVFAFLVFIFGLLYANIAVNSEKMAKQFKENGIYIIGIKSGKSTEKYISYILNRIAFFGSIYLAGLAIFALIIRKVLFNSTPSFEILSGTSLLILIVIGENIIGQIKDLLTQTKYLNFQRKRKDPFLW